MPGWISAILEYAPLSAFLSISYPAAVSAPCQVSCTWFHAVAAAARETHTLLEINNSSLRPGSIRIGAKDNCARLLERCAHYGASVIMGSDAHCEADAGNHRYAIELLEELQFPEELIVNTSLDRAASFLPCLAARLDDPLLRAREADARRVPSHSAATDEPSVSGGM